MKKQILISSPSLDVNKNVSGISALVRPLIENYPELFRQLEVGTPDDKKGFVSRFLYLVASIFGIIKFGAIVNGDRRFHLNTAADNPSLFRDSILLVVARVLLLRTVVQFHGGKWITTAESPLYAWLLIRFLCTVGHRCVVLGPDEVDTLREKFGVQRQIDILPNYVNPEYVCDVNKLKKIPFTFLFLGRLVESKSVDKLREILQLVLTKVPNAQLLVCGDGPMRAHVLKDLSPFPSSSWKYLGVVSGERKKQILLDADVFILPSVTGEGMPIAMLEAMASGAIPVVTKLGAIGDVVDGEKNNGYISQSGDINAFANNVINSFISSDRESMRSNAINTGVGYSLVAYKKRLLEIYYG
jgi:glycosyltransferase involved in cell wall biosynthesis